MNDPAAARTEPARSGRATYRGRPGPGLRAAAESVARALFVAAGPVTGYHLLPLDGGSTSGASALFACGLPAVVVVFSWEVRAIVRSPHPRLEAVEALGATPALFPALFASACYLLDDRRTAPRGRRRTGALEGDPGGVAAPGPGAATG